jgi:protein SCO1/2
MQWSYRVWLGLAAFFLSLPSARAVTRDDLAQVAAAPSPGAQVPTDLSVRVLDRPDVTLGSLIDRPTVLLFADYTCHTLCGPIVAFTGHALGDSGLQQGSDYQLVVIGIDPKVDPAAARSMKQAQLGPADRATFLLPDETQLKVLTEALGYRYFYDAANDQYAHAAAAYVLDRSGKVVRVLSGLGLDPVDFRLALVDAGDGKIGTISDRIHLLCYGFDPVQGAYNLAVSRLLSVTAAASVLGLGGLIGTLVMSGRRKHS